MGQRKLHQLYLLCLGTVIFFAVSYLMIFIHSTVFLLICVARSPAHFVSLQFVSFFQNLYFEEHKLKDTFTDNIL